MSAFRKIALFLTVTILLTLVCSCNQPVVQESSAPPAVSAVSEEESIDPGFYGYHIKNTEGYGGKTITFLTTYANSVNNWQIDPYSNPDFDESKASSIMSAIAERTSIVEQELDVDIVEEYIITTKRIGGSETYEAIINDISGGLAQYDVVMPATREAAILAQDGQLLDLASEVPGLDITNQWWCERYNEDTAIDGKVYFTVGDIGYINKNATMFTAFNKETVKEGNLCTAYGYETLYEMVDAKAWTQDVMYEMAKSVYQDLNENNICDVGDINGIAGQSGLVLWMLFASGERIARTQADGYPAITLCNDRAISAIEKTQEYAQSAKNGFIAADDYFNVSSIPVSDVTVPEFTGGRCLFFVDAVLNMELIRDMKQDFGVLPMPLYDNTQENYSSSISYWSADALCMTKAYKNDEARIEMVAEVLEAMGAASRAVLNPAYYTQTLQNQIARDGESERMLDIIFENRTIELADVYNWGALCDLVVSMYSSPKGSFTSEYQKIEGEAQKALEETVEIFKERS